MAAKKQKQLKITYIKSTIGCTQSQKKTLEALGLRKLNTHKIMPDNKSVRGAIYKIRHLLKVEEV